MKSFCSIPRLSLLFLFVLLLMPIGSHAAREVCTTGIEAFEKTLYQKLRSSCTKCHGDNGESVGHSVSDVNQAYIESLKHVDFLSLESSPFFKKVRNRHWIKHDPQQTGMTVDEMRSLLQRWWSEGESICPGEFTFKSPAQEIPAMEIGEKIELAFRLNSIREDFGDAQLKVHLERFSEPSPEFPGSYRLTAPRLITTDKTIRIRDVRFLLNGTVDPFENIYSPVDKVVSPNPVQPLAEHPTTLSTDAMVLVEREGPNSIQLALGEVQVTQAPDCRAVTFFNDHLYPLIQSPRCLDCHASSSQPFASEPETLCKQVLERTSVELPEESVFLQFAHFGRSEHPPVLSSEEYQTFIEWALQE